MFAFDPDAATAAYMETLSPAGHARATAYTHGSEWLLLWGWLAGVAAALLILRWGGLDRLRARIERAQPRPNRAVLGCVAVFLIADFVIELPWTIYAQWWRERGYGLSKEAFAPWLGEQLLSITVNLVMFGLVALALYAVMRRSPRRWWAWGGAVAAIAILIAMVIGPVVIEPLFNTYTPAPPGPTRDAVVALAQRTGVPSDRIVIYDGSRQSERYTANVSGLFGSARVAMSDTMFEQNADLAEVRGVVGHEMGHYVHAHALWLAAATSLLAVLIFFLLDRLFGPVAARLAPGRFVGVSDPAALPVLVMIVSTLALVATPLTNSMSRTAEADADNFSLRYAHEPDGLSKALVKTIAYRASSPEPIEEMVFYDHPSVSWRVHNAMLWKAAHPDLVGK